MSLLSWPSPMRQPRNVRVLAVGKPRSAHVTVLSALDSALAATAPPAPPPPPPLPGGGGALLPAGSTRTRSARHARPRDSPPRLAYYIHAHTRSLTSYKYNN
jgi:hypothetical protein